MDTPASLLERLRQPAPESAWTRFVQLYTPLLFFWARRLGLRDADAADLVQDVLVLLVRKLPEFSYDRNKSFRAWLRTVTLNCWRNGARRTSKGNPCLCCGPVSGICLLAPRAGVDAGDGNAAGL